MVRRITMDEASANFKAIVERALENGDSIEFVRNDEVIGVFRPSLPEPPVKVSLGQLLRELDNIGVDEDFAKDVQWAVDNQGTVDFTDPWEKYGDDAGHERTDPVRKDARHGPDHAA